MSLLLSDPDTVMNGWFNVNQHTTLYALMKKPSSIAYGFYRNWSQNNSTSNFFRDVRKMKSVKFFNFLFKPIGRWKVTFLSKCIYCMKLANSSRKKRVNTSSIEDGVRFSTAWKKLMFAPLSDLWNLTAIHHCTATISVIGTEGFVARLYMTAKHFCDLRLQQTASRRDMRLSRVLGDKFHSIDQKQRCMKTERMLYVQQHLLDVYEHGTQIHDQDCKRIYFQTCEIGEWAMRDLTTGMLNHGLPHMNHSQAYLSFFQNQNTRSRLITYGVQLPLVSLALRNHCSDLERGVVYPAFIFAKLFSAGQWGVFQSVSVAGVTINTHSDSILCDNSGRRELQLIFLEWRLPVFANYYTVEGAIEYLSLMWQSQRTALFNPTSIERLIQLLEDENLAKANSGVVKTFRQLLSQRMTDFYDGTEMTESRKTKMKTKFLYEWGSVYHINGEGSRRYYIVCATLPIYAGGENGTFLDIEDMAMNFYAPSFVNRVLDPPASLSEKDLDIPGADTAGRLILIQMPRGQCMSSLSVMEYHGADLYQALCRAGLDQYSSEQRVFGLILPEFADKDERKIFMHNVLEYERNEHLLAFFRNDEPSATGRTPAVALAVIFEVCSMQPVSSRMIHFVL